MLASEPERLRESVEVHLSGARIDASREIDGPGALFGRCVPMLGNDVGQRRDEGAHEVQGEARCRDGAPPELRAHEHVAEHTLWGAANEGSTYQASRS